MMDKLDTQSSVKRQIIYAGMQYESNTVQSTDQQFGNTQIMLACSYLTYLGFICMSG